MIEVKFRPKIKLKNIDMKYNESSTKGGLDVATSTMGIIPMVVIKGVVISEENIIYVKLDNSSFLPTIEVSFIDTTNQLIEKQFPLDNEILSIFIKSNSELIMPVRMDFKILSFNPIKDKSSDNLQVTFKVSGKINVDELYYSNFKAYKGNSYDVLSNIAKECNLGFASNINKTNDSMTWINPNHKTMDFIQEVVEYSYKDDSSFLWSYIDFYYNIVYVDLETSLTEDISTQQSALPYNVTSKSKQENITPLFLSNHPDLKNSNQYINKFNLNNSSTDVNLNIGYQTTVRFYNKSDNNMNSTKLDTISSVGIGDQIVLKDQPDSNSSFRNNVIGGTYIGKLDTDNVHENYLYAFQQNSNNLDFLQKVKMNITIKGSLNFSLYRFQKVLVKIYNLSDPEKINDERNAVVRDQKDAAQLDESKINQRLSGEWLITGINYTFSKNYGNVQEVTLVKRELSALYSQTVKK